MPNTPVYGLPYPALTDQPNGPAQLQALALAIEPAIQTAVNTLAARKFYSTRNHTAGFTVPTGAWTTVTGWANVAAVGITYVNGVWTIPSGGGGYYGIAAQLGYEGLGSPAGQRAARLLHNSTIVDVKSDLPSSIAVQMPLKYAAPLAAGDTITIQSFQSQGSSISISTDPGYNHFSIFFVSQT